ncbi:MAG: response regulator [Mariprofundus sp.]|nr:response regulator [Mariprofundus sp.]
MSLIIVDDNEDITEFLACLLSDIGLQVNVFNHPVEALSHIDQHKLTPRLLITDYNLPSINGVELHRLIRLRSPEVRTMVISGRNAQADVGELPFLQKPFQPEQVIAWVTSDHICQKRLAQFSVGAS